LLALACGATVEAAARQFDLSERTVYRRLKDPAFQARLKQVRTDMVRRSAGLLSAASGEAVRTLLALMKASAPPATRLGAAAAGGVPDGRRPRRGVRGPRAEPEAADPGDGAGRAVGAGDRARAGGRPAPGRRSRRGRSP